MWGQAPLSIDISLLPDLVEKLPGVGFVKEGPFGIVSTVMKPVGHDDFSDKELSVFAPRIRARFCVFCKTVPNGVLSKLTIYDIIAPETNHIGVGNERFLRAR